MLSVHKYCKRLWKKKTRPYRSRQLATLAIRFFQVFRRSFPFARFSRPGPRRRTSIAERRTDGVFERKVHWDLLREFMNSFFYPRSRKLIPLKLIAIDRLPSSCEFRGSSFAYRFKWFERRGEERGEKFLCPK